AKAASNWVMTVVLARMKEQPDASIFPLSAAHLGELLRLVGDGTLSNTMARDVFVQAADSKRAPADIVREQGLAQVRDTRQIDAWVAEVVAQFPDEVARYRAGDTKLLSFFMGQLMKVSRG